MNEWRMVHCCYAVNRLKNDTDELWQRLMEGTRIEEAVAMLYESYEIWPL